MNKDMIFENTVVKVVQAAQKVAQLTKNWNSMELSQNWYKAYFNHADMMSRNFENTVTKVVQMPHKVAVMTKELNCIELSQNWYMS